jgi:hypothetical protein
VKPLNRRALARDVRIPWRWSCARKRRCLRWLPPCSRWIHAETLRVAVALPSRSPTGIPCGL